MLQLNYKKIANWEDVCLVTDMVDPRKQVENPWNFAMGVFMMHTGISKLTRKNAAEFYMRAKLVETCYGHLYSRGDGTPRYLTTDDVAAYIGLSSNVSTYTATQFFGHFRKDVVRSLRVRMEDALREQAKADAAPVGK